MIFCALLALTATLPPPPPAPPPNTEAVTNIPIAIDADRLGYVRFALSLDVTPSNNVELAIGNDADGDGHLSLEEADITFGYDCGVWFRAETETGSVTEESAPTSGHAERTLEIQRRHFNPAWNIMKIVRRGTDETQEIVTLHRYYPGFLLMIK